MSNRDIVFLRNTQNKELKILKFTPNIYFSTIFSLIIFLKKYLQFYAIYIRFRFRAFEVLKGVILGYKIRQFYLTLNIWYSNKIPKI